MPAIVWIAILAFVLLFHDKLGQAVETFVRLIGFLGIIVIAILVVTFVVNLFLPRTHP